MKKVETAVAKKKKGPSPALKREREEVEKKKKALKNANARKREAEDALESHLAGRALRFGAGFASGVAAGAITEGLRGSSMGVAADDGEGFFDTGMKASLVPAAFGLGAALLGGGNSIADAAAIGLAGALASELGKAGVEKLREEDDAA